MDIRFVTPRSGDFRTLAAKLDDYYFQLVGPIQLRYAQVNLPENMDRLAVAYRGELPVACGAWKRIGEKTAELKRIFVLPEQRRQGTATALIRALEVDAAAAGMERMILETAVSTESSSRLYLSMGYKKITYYGSPAGAENCLCFEKELNGRME